MQGFGAPMLPDGLLHDMVQIVATGQYDQDNGGQWVKGDVERIPFRGVVMPLSNEDLRYAPSGTYTANSQKVYTNDHRLAIGAQITDLFDGQTYTVTQELTHGPIHSMKRYQVERKGVSAPK